MKYIRFNDKKVDTGLFLQLQDLATVLTNMEDLEFEYNFGSFIDIFNRKITASHFWDNHEKDEKVAGYKTDIFLRAVGTLHHTSLKDVQAYVENIEETNIKKFAIQLFTLLEDLRLEERCKKERPGTKRLFFIRKSALKRYYDSQLNTNVTRGFQLDELFCLIYLILQSDTPDPVFPFANSGQIEETERLKPLLYEVYEARRTSDIVRICERIVFSLDGKYKDSMNEYYILPIIQSTEYVRNTLFDELTRNDELANCDTEDVDEDKSETIDEKFSTWHRENENGDRQQTFLQFELESGTKTSLMGEGVRESDDADQAIANVQGHSGESKKKDYSDRETLNKQDNRKKEGGKTYQFGEENKHAVKLEKKVAAPTTEETAMYKEYVKEIEHEKRKLSSTIEKTLEKKKTSPRRDLLIGRLSKKLLPIVLEKQPRVFYKKTNRSKEIDAVFTLLVDCSASMNDKMEETKKGIVLFHEVLKKLRIPHSIIGFWEDANDVKEDYQPNYFHIITNHDNSLYHQVGPEIMQLEPEEDNRDGFSIRVVTKQLEGRHEKNKFLLIFSDGEPAAANYDQNGIIDTYEAVLEARKKRIEVIGMFLASGMIEESDAETMKNIYGKEHLLVPSVSELPEQFAPLLKKLLLKSI